MINTSDVVNVTITDEELAVCKEHPVPGCTRESTGQLKALGNVAVMKVLGIPVQDFEDQAEAATEMGSAYVCEIRGGMTAGIAPTVSTVHDTDVLGKRIIVPANQLYKHPYLHSHFTVGVFMNCEKDAKGVITHVVDAMVAGWIHTNKLKRWIKKGGLPPFTVHNASLAVAPCDVLLPMDKLLSTVRWKQFCVYHKEHYGRTETHGGTDRCARSRGECIPNAIRHARTPTRQSQ